jgi:hypothetical protein
VARALPVPESWNVAQVGPFVAVAAALRNYQSRRCLGGLNAKDIYRQKQRRGRWNHRQRHQAFEWISCHANETKGKTKGTGIFSKSVASSPQNLPVFLEGEIRSLREPFPACPAAKTSAAKLARSVSLPNSAPPF